MARRGGGVSSWTVVLGAALLLAVAAIVWVLANRAEVDAPEDLTVPPVELPDAPLPPGPTPTPDAPSLPTPGPT